MESAKLRPTLQALAFQRGWRWLGWMYRKIPGLAPVAERVYRAVARHPVALSRWTALLYGERPQPARYFLTRSIYLKALGITYISAFVSFWVQAKGLVGPEGILPSGFSDSSLHLLCGAGVISSLLLVSGKLPTAATAIAWLSYWLISQAGQDFLAFQWDALMLEMGFFSLFLTLGRREPARPMIWLMRWLLFRVVFFSGYVKLASHDPVWRDLTALKYHFETQPLPTWIGWWFHQLPLPMLKFSAALMFVLELAAPILFFFPRRPRFLAFLATVFLQSLIDLTGNYGFFGLQTVTLSLLLLDDQFLEEKVPRVLRWLPKPISSPDPRWHKALEWLLVTPAMILVAGTTIFHSTAIAELAAPFNSIHSYGVFAVMTQERDEIVFEGSRDGEHWQSYEFKWKPGDDLKRRPAFVEPHMPRLDWQLWFAALGSPNQNPWVLHVAVRLLQGARPVLGLFKSNPFPNEPPKYIRASFYRYHFTDWNTLRRTGDWWRREALGLYLPALSLR